MKGYFISKNYRSNTSAAGKAKIDCEDILIKNGYVNIGLKRTISTNNLYGFIRNLFNVLVAAIRLKSGSTLILQYPLKKYHRFICRIAVSKKCRIITIIHDLRSLRRKKVAIDREIRDLNMSDVLIVHNENMKAWLKEQGCTSKMVILGIFDYLSEETPVVQDFSKPVDVVFAGSVSYKRSYFPSKFSPDITGFRFNLYGGRGELDSIKDNPVINYKGIFDANVLISKMKGHFGLVWDGPDLNTCSGGHGEYLIYNNPHKTSLYIRCHLPVIIWSESAMAGFVKENNIGIVLNSIENLEKILSDITEDEYSIMMKNTESVAGKLKNGYYLATALDNC